VVETLVPTRIGRCLLGGHDGRCGLNRRTGIVAATSLDATETNSLPADSELHSELHSFEEVCARGVRYPEQRECHHSDRSTDCEQRLDEHCITAVLRAPDEDATNHLGGQ
jgi:hypothetical protein